MATNDRIIGITDLRAQAKTLFDRLDQGNVIVVRHAKPVGIIVHPDRLERLRDRIDDLEDQLAILANDGELIPHDVAVKELLGRD